MRRRLPRSQYVGDAFGGNAGREGVRVAVGAEQYRRAHRQRRQQPLHRLLLGGDVDGEPVARRQSQLGGDALGDHPPLLVGGAVRARRVPRADRLVRRGFAGVCVGLGEEVPVAGGVSPARPRAARCRRRTGAGPAAPPPGGCAAVAGRRRPRRTGRRRRRAGETGGRPRPERDGQAGRPGAQQDGGALPVRRKQHRHGVTGAQAAPVAQQRRAAGGPVAEVRGGQVDPFAARLVDVGQQRRAGDGERRGGARRGGDGRCHGGLRRWTALACCHHNQLIPAGCRRCRAGRPAGSDGGGGAVGAGR